MKDKEKGTTLGRDWEARDNQTKKGGSCESLPSVCVPEALMTTLCCSWRSEEPGNTDFLIKDSLLDKELHRPEMKQAVRPHTHKRTLWKIRKHNLRELNVANWPKRSQPCCICVAKTTRPGRHVQEDTSSLRPQKNRSDRQRGSRGISWRRERINLTIEEKERQSNTHRAKALKEGRGRRVIS